MIIDSKGKLFGKVSIIDLLIVLVLVGAVAGVGYKFIKSSTESIFVKTETLEIEFYQERVNDFTADAVKVGDAALENEQSADFGKVTNVQIGEAASWNDVAPGHTLPASTVGFVSVHITMEASGIVSDTGVKIGTGTYSIGKTITLKVGKAIFSGRISAVNVKG